MDRIFLRGLEVSCIVGIYEWERAVPQVVRLDLELSTDVRHAARRDSIEDATDYKSISKAVIALVKASRFALIETLAEEVARVCLDSFGIGWVRVAASKPGAIRGSEDVGVLIERGVAPDSAPGHLIYLGVGSNIEPERNIPEGLAWLRERFDVSGVSPVYQSAASGSTGQPDFLNLVVECRTDRDPFGAHAETRAIEERMGRRRGDDRYAPRSLDIDLLLYDSLVRASGSFESERWGMVLPHRQVLEEAFVFVPLLDLCPQLRHPESGRLLAELVADRLPASGLRRREDLELS